MNQMQIKRVKERIEQHFNNLGAELIRHFEQNRFEMPKIPYTLCSYGPDREKYLEILPVKLLTKIKKMNELITEVEKDLHAINAAEHSKKVIVADNTRNIKRVMEQERDQLIDTVILGEMTEVLHKLNNLPTLDYYLSGKYKETNAS